MKKTMMFLFTIAILASCKDGVLQNQIDQTHNLTITSVHNSSDTLILIVCGERLRFRKVCGGAFMLGIGQSDDNPLHVVTLSDYYMAETEVTQGLWKKIMLSNPSHFKGDSLPVENVSYYDCVKFINRLNTLSSWQFSLPTEAQWEFAARGGTSSLAYDYSGSNYDDSVAWHIDNSLLTTHPVAQKQPNELGLYDMSGNVFEWCSDRYGDIGQASLTDPIGPTTGNTRVIRGGSWHSEDDACKCTTRNSLKPNKCNEYTGFRLVF